MKPKLKVLFTIFCDCVVIFTAVISASLLLNTGQVPWLESLYLSLLLCGVLVGGLYYYDLYRSTYKYISHHEFFYFARVVMLGFLFIYTLNIYLNLFEFISISVYFVFLSWCFSVTGISLIRIGVRLHYSFKNKGNYKGKRTLIIGAGEAGLLVLTQLKKSADSPLYPVVFLDDDLSKVGTKLYGVPIEGTINKVEEFIHKHKIETIIIAIPSATTSEIKDIVQYCSKTRVEIKILPKINDIIHGRLDKTIRDVNVEDLLGREPIRQDLKLISGYLADKTVLVSGAGGSIGSEICRQVARFEPKKILLLGHGENSIYLIERELHEKFPELTFIPVIGDVQDLARIKSIFDHFRPDVVFHAAAHKHVPLMEENPSESVKNNVMGTKNMADCANMFNVEQFVYVSTDKAVNPTSVMGATKRLAELYIQSVHSSSKTRFATVRFGNVLGSRGSVIPLFMNQIRSGGPVTVTHPDMTRFFMTIPEAVQLVLQAGTLAKGGETYVLDMGKPVKIYDLAKNLIILSGLIPEHDIDIQFTGMRPGEKLYEELFSQEEGNNATKHELIFVAKPSVANLDVIMLQIKGLLQHVRLTGSYTSSSDIKKMIKEIIPSYTYDKKE
ncbi:polysaccharide biosynthesis protein [Jeotgalibacillus salarius]|uniref:Polysaccharide biosynthesis protein n=1 Tax=Jeotgalibacillus salarius TaxID=546023 RepID=A0A4Y8LQ42_9BACL|nr:nucleoside-diphosphate sugar epimerase/dehydratase [Jeotgalibacillus salarius]TFE04131.1 polysaccharide biosynthesis protein [Jeotgalibacillus salarius]